MQHLYGPTDKQYLKRNSPRFDNATTISKAKMMLSQIGKCSMKTPKEDKTGEGIEVNEMDEDGNIVNGTDGKVLKSSGWNMGDAKFADGSPQKLYFHGGSTHEPYIQGNGVLLASTWIGLIPQNFEINARIPNAEGYDNVLCAAASLHSARFHQRSFDIRKSLQPARISFFLAKVPL